MSMRVKFDEPQKVYLYTLRGGMHTSSTTMSDGVLNDKSCLNRETKFIDADSSYYHDILYVYGNNSSDQAVRLNFHENFGGTAQFRLQMAASSSNSITFAVPWRATEKGTAWWADYEVYGGVTDANDVTNTTVTLFAQYIRVE
jgi:hypothetical protein